MHWTYLMTQEEDGYSMEVSFINNGGFYLARFVTFRDLPPIQGKPIAVNIIKLTADEFTAFAGTE